jgi:hypothetical protein
VLSAAGKPGSSAPRQCLGDAVKHSRQLSIDLGRCEIGVAPPETAADRVYDVSTVPAAVAHTVWVWLEFGNN